MIDVLVHDVFKVSSMDELKVVISRGIKETKATLELSAEILEMIMALQFLPSMPKSY